MVFFLTGSMRQLTIFRVRSDLRTLPVFGLIWELRMLVVAHPRTLPSHYRAAHVMLYRPHWILRIPSSSRRAAP